MGAMTADYTFNDGAPELSAICDKITDLCSLPVAVVETMGELDAHYIAFHCAQDAPLLLMIDRSSSVHNQDTQEISLLLYTGEESTLFMTTTLALEALGGISATNISEYVRRTYCKQISELELVERKRQAVIQSRKDVALFIALGPAYFIIWGMQLVWESLSSPFRFVWQKFQK